MHDLDVLRIRGTLEAILRELKLIRSEGKVEDTEESLFRGGYGKWTDGHNSPGE